MGSSVYCIALILLLSSSISTATLTTDFYSKSCPDVFSAIKRVVYSAISKERRIGASLLRLFFHDCFVNGCDGSLLLDDTSSFTGEKSAVPNKNSLRGFEVIDEIKAAVENACPGVVSCADILAITARDSVVILGGQDWKVKLGRRDARTASKSAANNNIPAPSFSFKRLKSSFAAKGLSVKDLVALSGAHTIGKARCTNFRSRIYNETNISRSFARFRQKTCPISSGSNNTAPLDLRTPTSFDNSYYRNLVNEEGLLHSDQQLFNNGSTDSLVRNYAIKPKIFSLDFIAGMIRMGDISPLTHPNGEIRKNCRKIN